MVPTVKVNEPTGNVGYEGQFVRVRSLFKSPMVRTPPPRGGHPLFGTNFIDGFQWLDSSPDCTIVAGRIDCSRNRFPYFQVPQFEIIDDGCNFGITMSLGGFNPTNYRWFTYYRNPDCAGEPPLPENYNYDPTPLPEPCDYSKRELYIWWKIDFLFYKDFLVYHSKDGAAGWADYRTESYIDSVTFVDDEYINNKIVYARIKATLKVTFSLNKLWLEWLGEDAVPDEGYSREYSVTKEFIYFVGDKYQNLGFDEGIGGAGVAYSTYREFERDSKHSRTYREKYAYSRYVYPYDNVISVGQDEQPITGATTTTFRTFKTSFQQEVTDALGFRYFIYRSNIDEAIEINGVTWYPMRFCEDQTPEFPPKKKIKPPPPPPPPMRCCPDNSGLLKQILKIVKENKEAIGVEDLPASVPQSLVKKGLYEPGQVDKPNLVQLLGWYFERFDEIMGQFEINITVEDDDPVTQGNQTQTITLPNIAECLAEIMMLLINNSYNSEVSLNLATRNLVETGQTKQNAYVNHEALLTIIDYLGFGTRTVTDKLPLTYTPGKESFEELFVESEIDVPVLELSDTRTMPTILQELLHAASIIRALYWRKLDSNQDFQQQIKNNINSQIDFINKVSDETENND
jgi:hypothetical protein